ncbi:MAG: hypothetical protein ACLFUI_06480 [Halanaerobiales bacterium]
MSTNRKNAIKEIFLVLILVLLSTQVFCDNIQVDIKDILESTEKWYGPKPGVYPQSPELIFECDGTLSVREFYNDGDSTGWNTSYGEYQIKDGYIQIFYNDKKYKGVFEGSKLYIEDFCFYPYFTTTIDTGL